jgi:hypothetical protein
VAPGGIARCDPKRISLAARGRILALREAMDRTSSTRLALAALVCTCAAACTTPLATMTILATRDTGTAAASRVTTPAAAGPSAQPAAPVHRVEGVDCAHFVLLGIPVAGGINSSLERAMGRALAQVPEGNALTDVTIYTDVLLGYVYNRLCMRVRGNASTLQ